MATNTFAITHLSDVAAAVAWARRCARQAGLADDACDEVALCVAELASNVVKFAGCGELFIDDDGGRLRLVSQDRGPGLDDAAALFAEGHSSLNVVDEVPVSLGGGGASLSRFMDTVVVHRRRHGGLTVCAERAFDTPRSLS